MSSAYEISEIAFSILILYSITNVLDFYGISFEDYSVYIAFYAFLLLYKRIFPAHIENI